MSPTIVAMAEVAPSVSAVELRAHELLVPVVLDLALGDRRLQDSLHWPLRYRKVKKEQEFSNGNPIVFDPIDQDQLQLFATQLCSDLDMPSAFDAAVAKAIRSQLNAFQYMYVGREKLLVRKKIGLENYKNRKAESLAFAAAEERRHKQDEEDEAAYLAGLDASFNTPAANQEAADGTPAHEGAPASANAAVPPPKKEVEPLEIPVVDNPPGIEITHREKRVTIWVRPPQFCPCFRCLFHCSIALLSL